jgi:hypothetical protein
LEEFIITTLNATGDTFGYYEEKSAASFCRQMAAWFPDMFCNFYLVIHHKIVKNSATTKAGEKNKRRFGILIILEFFDA